MSNLPEFSQTRGKARKAVILARVSTKDQEEGYSIDAQLRRQEQYCSAHGLEVIKVFQIIESSTVGDREKFMEIIAFIKRQKETIAIVADKVDRVQRSFKEYPLLDELIKADRLELHFRTENYIITRDSNSHQHMMWNFSIMMAKAYTDNIRDNVNRSIAHKIRLGQWIAKAPIGYLNAKDENGRSTVIIDTVRAPLVKKMFEEYAAGITTLSEMANKTKKWGLTNKSGNKTWLQKSKIHEILNNPFYYGQMRIKGELHDHCYEQLISKKLFDACQAVMKGWNKKPFKYAGKEFVFRGLLTCSVTGRMITADTKKKKYASGKIVEWTYLRCWNPDNPERKMWVREDKVIKQVDDMLGQMRIPKYILDMITAYLRDTQKAERDFHARHTAELHRQHSMIQGRLNGLMDLLLDGLITKKEFETKRQNLRVQQDDIEKSLSEGRAGDDRFKDTMLVLLDIFSRAQEVFAGSTIEQKRALINVLFANLRLKGATLCYELNIPFNMFFDCRTVPEWRSLVDDLRTNLYQRVAIIDFSTTRMAALESVLKVAPSIP